MLRLTWMSPHKPDPKLRKVDVDISAVLIGSDETDQPALSDNAGLTNAYSFRWQDGRPIDNFGLRIGWSGWANLIFVIAACLVGFFCAPFVFDSPQYLRSHRHGFDEVPYARADLSEVASHQVASRTPSLAAPQFIQSKMNLPEQRTPVLDWNPSSSGLPPFGHSGDLPALQSGDRIVDSGLSSSGLGPLHSTGFASANMSESIGSNGQSKSDEQQVMGKVTGTRPHVFRQHAHMSSVPSPKRISSGRQNFLASLFSGTRDATAGKSMAQSRQQSSNARNEQRSVHALQIGSSRTAMDNSMPSIQASVAAMQNRADANVMRTQNAMMSQAPFHGGVGLGGLGGGLGNLSAGARR